MSDKGKIINSLRCPECHGRGEILRDRPKDAIGTFGRDPWEFYYQKCWKCKGDGIARPLGKGKQMEKYLIRFCDCILLAKCADIPTAEECIDNHYKRNIDNFKLLTGKELSKKHYQIINIEHIPVYKRQLFIREGTFEIEDILPYVSDIPRALKNKYYKTKEEYREATIKEFTGRKVKMDSARYQLFKTKGTKCVKCGIEGSFFALECHRSNFKNDSNPSFHFNLYGISENGQEVLITKDHIVPKSKGGKNNIDNYQVMCTNCNKEKDNKIE